MKKINYLFIPKLLLAGVFFIFTFSKINAQSKDSAKITKPSIALDSGATLFSTDSAFNRQISTNKILREKAEVSYRKDKNGGRILEMQPLKSDSINISERNNKADKNRKKVKQKGKNSEKYKF